MTVVREAQLQLRLLQGTAHLQDLRQLNAREAVLSLSLAKNLEVNEQASVGGDLRVDSGEIRVVEADDRVI